MSIDELLYLMLEQEPIKESDNNNDEKEIDYE